MATEAKAGEQKDPRPFWRGTIAFGLVSVPVELYPAVRSHRVPLRMLSPEGIPLKRRYYCSDDGKELSSEDIVRGYEREDGSFVVVDDEELEALSPQKSREIDLRRFVNRNEIPIRLFERPYVLAPAGESTKAYHLLAETMERTNRAGIATFVMRGKEYLAAIFAEGGLLRAATLRFPDELRTPDDVGLPEPEPAQAKLKREMQAALKKLRAKELDLGLLFDEDAANLLTLAERKRADSLDIVEIPESELDDEEEDSNVVDIMSFLKRRIEGEDEGGDDASDDPEGLENQTKHELYQRAQELDVKGRSTMTKDELIAAIRAKS